MVVIGFTGTRKGATAAQLRVVRGLLATQRDPAEEDWLHHGDAIGADEQIHGIAKELGYKVAIHPSNISSQRAFCEWDRAYRMTYPLSRNCNIVTRCSQLLACPFEADEQPKGGTWFTIRYARAVCRPVAIILPNGLIRLENRQ